MNVTEKLDEIMERASQALAGMDYLTCEALCVQALAEARDQKRYRYYARVLLPLQEARRQRRMIAAQGKVLLNSSDPETGYKPWYTKGQPGCVVLTRPSTIQDAAALEQQARDDGRFVEVLFADNEPGANPWVLRSCEGPAVTCEVDAPADGQDPAQWFLHATELLGDAALASVDDALTGEALVSELETRLRVFPDHELLHQHLANAAHAVGS